MTNRKPLMAGNWKMNVDHLEAVPLVQKIAEALKNAEDAAACDVAVIPPFTDLRSIQAPIDDEHYPLKYGAQDVSAYESGAYTGEISAKMLARLGCTYVVVGHSERRQYHYETDEIVNAKAKAALKYGLVPIVCVGEALEVRKAGEQVPFTLAQVAGSLADLSAEQVAGLVIAYEPVWAIGTGEVATPADAQEVCGAIRGWVATEFGTTVAEQVRILYGGSVKASNVASIMAESDVDGALVGGASLDPDEFVAIARYRLHPADN